MSGQPAGGHGAAGAVTPAPADARFLDQLRSDPELLALEFAMVTADLSIADQETAPRPPRRRCAVGTRRAPSPRRDALRSPEPSAGRGRAPRRRPGARQRGPPPAGAPAVQPRRRPEQDEEVTDRHRIDRARRRSAANGRADPVAPVARPRIPEAPPVTRTGRPRAARRTTRATGPPTSARSGSPPTPATPARSGTDP